MPDNRTEKLNEMGTFLKISKISDQLKRELTRIIAAAYVNLNTDDFIKLCNNIKGKINSLERKLN